MSALLAAEVHVEAGDRFALKVGAVDEFGAAVPAEARRVAAADAPVLAANFQHVDGSPGGGLLDEHLDISARQALGPDAVGPAALLDLDGADAGVFRRGAAGEQQDKEQGRAHGFGSDDKWVIQYLDIPFLAKGRTREGLDCWGLIRLAWAEQCGVALPLWLDGYRDTAPCAHTAAHLAACAETFREIPPGSACPGDILLFRTGRHLSHVGLALAGGRMLHITAGIDSCTERYTSPRWLPRLVGVYRPEARHG